MQQNVNLHFTNKIYYKQNLKYITYMKNLLIVLFAFSWFIPISANYNHIPFYDKYSTNTDCMLENSTFSIGESLSYKVYYNASMLWINVGKATFDVNETVLNGKNVLHTVSTGRTNTSGDWIFKVRDRYESYIDPVSMRPLKFIREVSEGGYNKKNYLTFQHSQNKVIIDKTILKGKVTTQNKSIPISSCAQDLLSAVYYARCLDYKSMHVGEVINLDLFIDDDTYPIGITFLGYENVKTDLGKFRCAKFTPTLLQGDVFSGDEKMVVYVTDDANKLPVLIESPLSVGYAKVYLNSFKGLRYPLEAKL